MPSFVLIQQLEGVWWRRDGHGWNGSGLRSLSGAFLAMVCSVSCSLRNEGKEAAAHLSPLGIRSLF